jgi:hypothetical protein
MHAGLDWSVEQEGTEGGRERMGDGGKEITEWNGRRAFTARRNVHSQ